MKKIAFAFVLVSSLLIGCGGDNNSEQGVTKENNNEDKSNCLDFAISEKYNSLDPINITDVASFHIGSQIFEPLLRFDENDLTVKPLLAESWEVGEDNLTHTFNLKKGVYFQDNECFEGGKGRELKASDVLYTFKRILSSENSYAFNYFEGKIEGAKEFTENGAEISGINIVDDYTISFKLTKPSSNFISLMATISTGIVAKEAIEKNVVVGTGPFIYNPSNDTEQAVMLTKNNNYHIKGKPHIDCVAFNYVKSGQEQLDWFMEGKLDVITGLPSKSIKEIVEEKISDFQKHPVKYILERSPQAATSYLNLNTAIEPFNNVNVRKAFAMAIDKNKIVTNILKGEAAGPGDHGIVAAAIKKYDYSSIVGHEFNVEKARKLLAEAGFENGKGIPNLILATGKGNTSLRIAFEVQKQLQSNLNVNVEISSVTLSEKNKMNDASKCHMSLNGWLAEYPEPSSFLSIFYGKYVSESPESSSYPNESRFKNNEFDKLYEEALITLDETKRFELCLAADQIIANEVPGIPLWYHEDYLLVQSSIKSYKPNPMNIQYLVDVKIQK